jgi:phytoene dehydrogenase-like protein
MLRSANIIGSGPNGLAAAVTLAQRGVAVTVYERNPTLGGACSNAEVTLPGFHHDLGASAFPLGVSSPFYRSLPLADHGLHWVHPPASLAHPFDDGSALTLEPTLEGTVAQLSPRDGRAWRTLLFSPVRNWPWLVADVTQPLLRLPSHPLAMAAFGAPALFPAQLLASALFADQRTRALFAGVAAHSVLPLTSLASSATGILLAAAAHAQGWPVAGSAIPGVYGAQAISHAMASLLQTLGGRLLLHTEISQLRDLPPADVTLLDTSVETLLRIAGQELSASYRQRLQGLRRGPGIFKLDYALSRPIPWQSPACARAATVHLGGSLAEIAHSEQEAFYGHPSQPSSARPFVLLVQPSLFDPARAPAGQHTAWAYCHVPNGSNLDRTQAMEDQITRYAPGFPECVLARRASNAEALSAWNPNLVGGDISGGAMTLGQLLFRPTAGLYRTSNRRIYLCSSSTPPGGGVHGMCGHQAALAAWQDHGSA